MITSAKDFDVICFQLRKNLYPQLESDLKKELNRLSDNIKLIITSGDKIQTQPVDILHQIFNIRIKALKWLAADFNFDYLLMLPEIFSGIEDLKSNIKLEVLIENILFALRCNKRVSESLLARSEFSIQLFSGNLSQLPEITYEQFIASLAFANPDDSIAQKIADFTNASLHIEFVLVAADSINTDKLDISEKTVNELAFLISDSAQEYSALAMELGFLKPASAQHSFSAFSFDKNFINEQKQLADLGLEDLL